MNPYDVLNVRDNATKQDIDKAYDGEEGYYYADANIYDLIILDIMLPKVNGIEILKIRSFFSNLNFSYSFWIKSTVKYFLNIPHFFVKIDIV